MRAQERIRGLLRTPKLIADVLVRGQYDFTYDQMRVSLRRMSMAKRWNLFMSGANLIHRRLTPWSMPLHMNFELTDYCNLRCPVCATGSKSLTRPPVSMDAGLFERVIDQVGPYLLTASLWAWGEPLLHPELKQILRAIQKHKVFTLLSTNGQTLNNDRIIEALIDAPPTVLIVAIDGLTDEANAKFRIGAKLAPILEGVRRLVEIKRERGLQRPALLMRFIVMKHNQHQVPQLKEFVAQHQFDFLSVRTLSLKDIVSADQIHRQFVPDLAEYRAYGYENGERVRRRDYVCLEPFWFPSVFADGTLVACEQDYDAQQPLGVLKDGPSFADVWFGERAARVRKIIRDTPQALSFCQNCPFCDRPVTDSTIQTIALNAQSSFPIVIA